MYAHRPRPWSISIAGWGDVFNGAGRSGLDYPLDYGVGAAVVGVVGVGVAGVVRAVEGRRVARSGGQQPDRRGGVGAVPYRRSAAASGDGPRAGVFVVEVQGLYAAEVSDGRVVGVGVLLVTAQGPPAAAAAAVPTFRRKERRDSLPLSKTPDVISSSFTFI